MQYYVIDCEFVGTDIPDFIINESYTLTGFFLADSVFLSHLLQTITEQEK